MIMDVCADTSQNTINIEETAKCDDAKQKVVRMIANFRPDKSKTTNVEMHIVIKGKLQSIATLDDFC